MREQRLGAVYQLQQQEVRDLRRAGRAGLRQAVAERIAALVQQAHHFVREAAEALRHAEVQARRAVFRVEHHAVVRRRSITRATPMQA